ncbi:hypothetical protein HOA91_04970 [Candidatus Woesearchaeota archaeon]|jgi:hypothetical protein|nr:hypothetical protein [Candidatus Woesearchaeota archaeon]
MALNKLLDFEKSPVLNFVKENGKKAVTMSALGLALLTPASADALIVGCCGYYDTPIEEKECLTLYRFQELVMDDNDFYSGVHDLLLEKSIPLNHFDYSCSYEKK